MASCKLPTSVGFFPPPEGLKQHSFYKVEMSFGKGNPIHQGILYVGFLNQDKTLGNYCWARSGSDDPIEGTTSKRLEHQFYYCKVLKFLFKCD